MRDAVIRRITEAARADRSIMFLSADFGAPALDEFRCDLPDQFIHTGIAEQHMIDLAAGLALSGKKVFCYAMAPFITSRCYEQIKCSLGAMNLPVTLIGVGVGLGYDNTSMTHICIEDLACMRAINNMEIITPSDTTSAGWAAELALTRPALRYLRLDRHIPGEIYSPGGRGQSIGHGNGLILHSRYGQGDALIISTGYMTHVALDVMNEMNYVSILDVINVKPLDYEYLRKVIQRSTLVMVLEEHLISGGLASAILEAFAEKGELDIVFGDCRFRCFGIKDGFKMGNGDRLTLHKQFGIDKDTIKRVIQEELE